MPSPDPNQTTADRLIEFDERLRSGLAGKSDLANDAAAEAQPIDGLIDCVRMIEDRWPRSAGAIVEAHRRESGERRRQELTSDSSDSAQNLADDLRRTLATQPTAARPTTIWQRVARWFECKATGGE